MRFYKVFLTRGVPLILSEKKLDEALNYPSNLVKIWDDKHEKFELINKSCIVQSYFDHEVKEEKFELIDGVYKRVSTKKEIIKK